MRDDSNLILTTELGVVYFGTYKPTLFSTQLETLDRLRLLPEKLNPQSVKHIDLNQPNDPILEMHLPNQNKSSKTQP